MDSAVQELEMAKYHTKMIVNGSLWWLFQLTIAVENRLSHQWVELLPSLDFVDIICCNQNVTRKTQVPSLAPFVHRPSLLHSQLQMNSRGLAVWLKWIDRREDWTKALKRSDHWSLQAIEMHTTTTFLCELTSRQKTIACNKLTRSSYNLPRN